MNIANQLYKQNKTVYMWIFFINILSFGFMLTHTYYTHDSMWSESYIPSTQFLGVQGRVTGMLLNNILSDGVQLPYLMLFLSLIVNCISAILLSDVLDVSKDINKFIIGSIYTLFPYWSEVYVYYFYDFSYIITFFLPLVAIAILKRRVSFISIILSIFLYTFATLAYQEVLMVVPTLLLSIFILQLLDNQYQYKKIFINLIQHSVIFLLSILLYVLVIDTMEYIIYGKIVPMTYGGGSKFIVFDNIQHFIHKALYFYRSFTFYSSPITKGLFILLFFITVTLIFIRKINIISKILLLSAFVFLLFTPDIMELVHSNARYYHFTMFSYSIVYITIFLALLKLTKSKTANLIITICMVIPVYTYVKNNIFLQYNANINYLNGYNKYNKIIDKALEVVHNNNKTYNLYVVVDTLEKDTCLRSKKLQFQDIINALSLKNYKHKFCVDFNIDIEKHRLILVEYLSTSYLNSIIQNRKIRSLKLVYPPYKYNGLIKKFAYLRNTPLYKQLMKNPDYLKFMKYDHYSEYSYKYIIIGNDLIFKTQEMNNN